MYAILLSAVIAPDVGRLGADRWEIRERAEERLRNLGPLAWGALLHAERSGDAESRFRARRLLRPYRSHVQDVRVAVLVRSRWPLTESQMAELFLDDEFRRRVYLRMREAGCTDHEAWYLLPERLEANWWGNIPPVLLMCASLSCCRARLGYHKVGWPFTH